MLTVSSPSLVKMIVSFSNFDNLIVFSPLLFRDRFCIYVLRNCNIHYSSTISIFAVLPLMFPWRHIPCAVLSSLPYGSAPFRLWRVISSWTVIQFFVHLWTGYIIQQKIEKTGFFPLSKIHAKSPRFFHLENPRLVVIRYIIMVKYLHQEDAYEKSIINTRKIVRFKKRPWL